MINIGGAGSRGGTPFAHPTAGLKRTYLDIKVSTPRGGTDQAMGDLSQIPDVSRTMNDEEEVNAAVSEDVDDAEFPSMTTSKRQHISANEQE